MSSGASSRVPGTPIYEQVSVKPEAVLKPARRSSGGRISSSGLLGIDAWNRLVETYEVGDESGDLDTGQDTLVVTYEYDGQKRRIETNVAGELGLDTYYNTQWQVLEVHEGGDAANPLKQVVWDVRYVDAPVVRFRDADTDGTIDDTLYYTTDANMNVTALVDTDGDVVERYAYDVYGQVTVLHGADDADGAVTEWEEDTGGSDWDNRVLFAGYRFDAETGLYHVRHRMYHATLGRWIQRDPVGYEDGMGLYEYVCSSPTHGRDPMGLERTTLRQSVEAVISNYVFPCSHDRYHYTTTLGFDKLAEKLRWAANLVGMAQWGERGRPAKYYFRLNRIYLQSGPYIRNDSVVHELIHAYDDFKDLNITWYWPTDKESAEALAYTTCEILGAMNGARQFEDVLLDSESKDQSLCATLKEKWGKLCKDLGFVMKYGKVIWSGNSRSITEDDVEAVHTHLGVSVKCGDLAEIYNDMMCDKKIPDDDDAERCCTVTCPGDLPDCFR